MNLDDVSGKPAIDTSVSRLLISALSHGLRTPLHSMLGFLELLNAEELDDDAHRLVQDAWGSADELLAASDRLLVLVRLLGGEQPQQTGCLSIPDLLREVAGTVGPRCDLQIVVNPYLPKWVRGDTESLRQLLAELVGNAVRHGGRRVVISAERTNAFTESKVGVRFTVYDSGSGLPASALSQLTATASESDETSGHLGLFLAQRLVERLGGTLKVEQDTETGTTITLEVNLDSIDYAVNATTGPARELATTALRVLLVEDNPVNRILAQRQMAKLGHQLETVTGGRAAVRAVLEGDYDVVLMDRHLPDLDGIESTRQIRDAERSLVPARHTPIIAVTADASHSHREECLAAGMDAFLTKPLDLEQLRAALAAVTAGSLAVAALEPEFDPAALQRLSRELDGDSDAVAELVRTFLDELPRRQVRLRVTLKRGAARRAAAAAETLRASSETVGAVKLARLCAEIHTAAGSGDVARGESLMPALIDSCRTVSTALDLTASALRG